MQKVNKPISEYCFEDSVGYLIARAQIKLTKQIDEALSGLDVTKTQGAIILKLAMGSCETAADLAREMYTDSASMTRMVDRLEKRGLVQRVRCEDDRRVVNLHLTEEGKALAEQLPDIFSTTVARSFGEFSTGELDTLRGLLRKFLYNDKQSGSTDKTNEKD